MLMLSPTYLNKFEMMNNQPAAVTVLLASQHKQGGQYHGTVAASGIVAALATYLAMLPVLKREKVSCNNATIKWHD